VRARGDEAPLELVVEDGPAASASTSRRRWASGSSPTCASRGRPSRRAPASGRVLNLFSYTGAFSLHTAKAGAREVVAVDLAPKAHARARRNYELSGLDPARPRVHHGRHDEDGREARVARSAASTSSVMRSADLLARSPRAVLGGARISRRFASTCLSVLEPGGLLVFATNSTKVAALEFDRALGEGARARRAPTCRVIERVPMPVELERRDLRRVRREDEQAARLEHRQARRRERREIARHRELPAGPCEKVGGSQMTMSKRRPRDASFSTVFVVSPVMDSRRAGSSPELVVAARARVRLGREIRRPPPRARPPWRCARRTRPCRRRG